jgi:hypothetical protein
MEVMRKLTEYFVWSKKVVRPKNAEQLSTYQNHENDVGMISV